eukprot:4619188-Amphidinium_carterae.1
MDSKEEPRTDVGTAAANDTGALTKPVVDTVVAPSLVQDEVMTETVEVPQVSQNEVVETQEHAHTFANVRMYLVMELAEILYRRKIDTVDEIAEAVTQANIT